MIQDNRLKILVCTHKEFSYKENEFFLPIHVGKEISDVDLSYQGDNTGDNISSKNKNYCEITALYWAWKNLPDTKYIGLCHYRRYFLFNHQSLTKIDRLPVLDFDEKFAAKINPNLEGIEGILENYDIIISNEKRIFFYLKDNYITDPVCLKSHFETVEEIILNKYPEYRESMEVVFKGHSLHHFNMFIMKTEQFSSYMDWLFGIFDECEKVIDLTGLNPVQARVYGFLSERLLTLYVHHNNLKKHQVKVGFINPDHRLFKYFKSNNYYINEMLYYCLNFLNKYVKKS